jgi:bifunctional UDP-N-acetylglucosamine pyrophosphorylase/glucosamine-1-phosphate N-acetyltransferase
MTQPVVLVLAGGVSSRFWPLRDKLLIEFGAHSLLERHLLALANLGCDRIVVVTRPDLVETVQAIGVPIDADVRIALQPEARGMADAVLSARPALEALGDGPLYITQAHDVVEGRLHAEVLESWARRDSDTAGILAAARVKSYFPGGYLTLDGQRATSIVEKPGAGNEPSDLVNLVAHVHASWRALSAGRQLRWMEQSRYAHRRTDQGNQDCWFAVRTGRPLRVVSPVVGYEMIAQRVFEPDVPLPVPTKD